MISTVFFNAYLIICIVIFLFGLFSVVIDLYSLSWRRVTANILNLTVESTRKTEKMTTVLYKLKVKYSYEYMGKYYESSLLNSMSSVIATDKSKIDRMVSLGLSDRKISVRVCPFFSGISFAFPYWYKNGLPYFLMLLGFISIFYFQ